MSAADKDALALGRRAAAEHAERARRARALRDRRILRFANSEQLAEAARIGARLALGVCDWCAVSHGDHEFCSATAKAKAPCACARAGHPHTRREDEE